MSKAYHAAALCATSEDRLAAVARVAPLGTYGKSSSTLAQPGVVTAERTKEILTARYGLRSEARHLLPNEAVARCGRALAPLSTGVSVLYSPSAQSSHFGGLQACHSVWMCPCCAAKITERRRLELTIALRQARAQGMQVVMCTYTFSHHRGQVLKTMMKSLTRAWSLFTSGRRSARLYEDFDVIGFVRALEVTYSELNWWHPHIHQLVFLPAGADIAAFAVRARGMWEDAAAAAGLSMDEHGFKLNSCDEKIADYIAKFGHEPSDTTKKAWEQGWNETNELTKWHTKQGHETRIGKNDHLTPMQLLRFSAAGDEWAGSLFQEYAGVFKGKRQLFWSPGLKALFNIKEMTDKEVAEQEVADAEKLAFLYKEEWQCVLGNDACVELLMVARSGLAWKVADFLYTLGLERFAPGGDWCRFDAC